MKTKCLHAITVATILLASALTTHAITFTDLVETPDTLSFRFSGFGKSDTPSLGFLPLTYWSREGAFLTQDPGDPGTYGFVLRFSHLGGSPIHTANVGNPSASAATFGTTLFATATVPHGTGSDFYTMSITVQPDVQSITNTPTGTVTVYEWGSFSGSFSAVHREPTSEGVPDAGGTLPLLGLALASLAWVQRRSGARRGS